MKILKVILYLDTQKMYFKIMEGEAEKKNKVYEVVFTDEYGDKKTKFIKIEKLNKIDTIFINLSFYNYYTYTTVENLEQVKKTLKEQIEKVLNFDFKRISSIKKTFDENSHTL